LGKELKYRVLFLMLYFSLLFPGCMGRPPENDVALIKELLVKFEKGLKEKNIKVLDSVISKKQKDLAPKLITDFSAWGEIKNIYIAGKRFTIVGDSAKVELKLKMRSSEKRKEFERFEKPVNLFLKKKGGWRIQTYEVLTDTLPQTKSRVEGKNDGK
jgi:hypothetical protein